MVISTSCHGFTNEMADFRLSRFAYDIMNQQSFSINGVETQVEKPSIWGWVNTYNTTR
jgi:hypothetical protein